MTEKFISFDNVDGVSATQGVYNPTSNPGGNGASQQANGTWVYNATTGKFEGTTGIKATVTTQTTTISRYVPLATNTILSTAFAFRVEQTPSKTFHAFASARNASGVAARVVWNTQNLIAVRGTGTSVAESQSTTPLTPGKWYYATWLLNATTNSFQLNIYDAVTREKLISLVNTNNAVGIGTTAFNGFDLGWINSDPVTGNVVYFDSFALDDGRTTERMPNAWSAPAQLAGQMWDGAALQNGSLQLWDGTALQALSAVSVN
jgi:hypothetical protein